MSIGKQLGKRIKQITFDALAKALNVNAKDFFDFNKPVLFRDRKKEARQKKECIDAISSELKEMEVRELMAVYNVLKGLKDKSC